MPRWQGGKKSPVGAIFCRHACRVRGAAGPARQATMAPAGAHRQRYWGFQEQRYAPPHCDASERAVGPERDAGFQAFTGEIKKPSRRMGRAFGTILIFRWPGELPGELFGRMAGPTGYRSPFSRDPATKRKQPRSTRRSTPRSESSLRAAISAAIPPAAIPRVPKTPSNRNRGRSTRRVEAGSVGDSAFSDDSDKDGFQPGHTLHLLIRILDRTQYTSTSKGMTKDASAAKLLEKTTLLANRHHRQCSL